MLTIAWDHFIQTHFILLCVHWIWWRFNVYGILKQMPSRICKTQTLHVCKHRHGVNRHESMSYTSVLCDFMVFDHLMGLLCAPTMCAWVQCSYQIFYSFRYVCNQSGFFFTAISCIVFSVHTKYRCPLNFNFNFKLHFIAVSFLSIAAINVGFSMRLRRSYQWFFYRFYRFYAFIALIGLWCNV